MLLPARRQVFSLSPRKCGMVEYEPRRAALIEQLKSRDGIHALRPALDTPDLDYALTRYEFDLPPDDIASEQRKGATDRRAEPRRLAHRSHGRVIHHPA